MSFESMLDHIATIKRPVEDGDGKGSYDNEFRPEYVDVACKISPATTQQIIVAGQRAVKISHIMSLRPLGSNDTPGITRQHRVYDVNNTEYEVVDVLPILKPIHHLKVELLQHLDGEGRLT